MKDDAYAILRVKPLTWSAVSAMTRHGRRLGPDMDHIDRVRSAKNRQGSEWTEDVGNLRACMESVMLHHAAKPRKGAPVGSHMLLTASASYFRPGNPSEMGTWDADRLEIWLAANLDWINRRWPKQLAAWRLDLDEATPHLDCFLVPIHAWKTKTGKVVTQVSHRNAFGSSRQSFAQLQNAYAAAMQPLGLKRGRPRSVTGAVHVHPAELRRRMAADAKNQRAIGIGVAAVLRGDLRRLRLDPVGRIVADIAPRVPVGIRPRLLDMIQPGGRALVNFEMRLCRSVARTVASMAETLVLDTKADRDRAAVLAEEAEAIRADLVALGLLAPEGIESGLEALARELVR
jgi:hypothetical protein